MKIDETSLAGLHEIQLARIDDDRGDLLRIFDAVEWDRLGGRSWQWAQAVTSFTRTANTLRGMHYQMPPHAEGKLVVPLAGTMFWASVDVRLGSPTFGQWHGTHLSPENGASLLAHPGFAHGCLSLSGSVSLLILSTQTHRAARGTGFRWDDPSLAIRWPDCGAPPQMSPAHRGLPSFSSFVEAIDDVIGVKEAAHA
ncbi:MAG: dTDP-4-dehydrorhamnose 3,5-epimerase family protein [Alphaproteobacteria bacterium]|nr:dTDP-4-dehydrorhamnose 3,5-epimerase family protein [Alphaproteobacteria bacterium]